jgi:hypothetical protein
MLAEQLSVSRNGMFLFSNFSFYGTDTVLLGLKVRYSFSIVCLFIKAIKVAASRYTGPTP